MLFSRVAKFLKVLPQKINASIKADINILQSSGDEDTFIRTSQLFLDKWRRHAMNRNDGDRICDFADYFNSQ